MVILRSSFGMKAIKQVCRRCGCDVEDAAVLVASVIRPESYHLQKVTLGLPENGIQLRTLGKQMLKCRHKYVWL